MYGRQDIQRPSRSEPGLLLARVSVWLLAAVPIGLIASVFWSNYVKTSPTLDDADRIRGWEAVWRDLPGTALMLAIVAVGLTLAIRGGQKGAVAVALRAIWWHGGALFFLLLIILGGSADNVMTTRSANVKWLLFPVEVGVSAAAIYFSRRAVLKTVPESK